MSSAAAQCGTGTIYQILMALVLASLAALGPMQSKAGSTVRVATIDGMAGVAHKFMIKLNTSLGSSTSSFFCQWDCLSAQRTSHPTLDVCPWGWHPIRRDMATVESILPKWPLLQSIVTVLQIVPHGSWSPLLWYYLLHLWGHPQTAREKQQNYQWLDPWWGN